MASLSPPTPFSATTIPFPSFGSALVGLIVASFLCGAMMVQTYVYFACRQSRRDSISLKILIILILILDVFQLACEAHYVYDGTITNWGNATWFFTPIWSANTVPLLTNIISMLVQLGYARRISILSEHGLVKMPRIVRNAGPIIIVILAAASFIFGSIIFVQLQNLKNPSDFGVIFWKIYAAAGCTVTADVVIVISLCYYLSKGRTGFNETDILIDKLLRIVINTGLLPSLFTLADVISLAVAKEAFIHIVFNFVAAKLYANSFMALLNARTLFETSTELSVKLSTITSNSLIFRVTDSPQNRSEFVASAAAPQMSEGTLKRRQEFPTSPDGNQPWRESVADRGWDGGIAV